MNNKAEEKDKYIILISDNISRGISDIFDMCGFYQDQNRGDISLEQQQRLDSIKSDLALLMWDIKQN